MPRPIMYNTLRRLKEESEVDLCYLISKKGEVIVGFGDIKKSMVNSFGTLVATIYGASVQTNKILNEKFPKKILLEDFGGFMAINHVDDDHCIVVRYKKKKDIDAIEKAIENAAWTLSQELEED
ncbi:MAG: roadblock/LC7 domain-containing protein [Thermoplasmata archaeon]